MSEYKKLYRYLSVGIVFFLIGPMITLGYLSIFPATISVILAYVTVHSIRFLIYKGYVFNNKNGYRKLTARYFLALATQIALESLLLTLLIAHTNNKSASVFIVTVLSTIILFISSVYIFDKELGLQILRSLALIKKNIHPGHKD